MKRSWRRLNVFHGHILRSAIVGLATFFWRNLIEKENLITCIMYVAHNMVSSYIHYVNMWACIYVLIQFYVDEKIWSKSIKLNQWLAWRAVHLLNCIYLLFHNDNYYKSIWKWKKESTKSTRLQSTDASMRINVVSLPFHYCSCVCIY